LGLTWLDWALILMLVACAIGGVLTGAISQVFTLLGVLTGLWAAVFVSGWVADHWHGARPAVVFLVLRWLVAALSGLALAALFQWWGDRLGRAVREGPLGWLDRAAGAVAGAAVGAFVGALLLMFVLTVIHEREPAQMAARARAAVPVMGVAAEVCSLGEGVVPGSGWLKDRFLAARRRAVHLREGARAKTI
jgi:uncharacterized membrane protein required for colicin V production